MPPRATLCANSAKLHLPKYKAAVSPLDTRMMIIGKRDELERSP